MDLHSTDQKVNDLVSGVEKASSTDFNMYSEHCKNHFILRISYNFLYVTGIVLLSFFPINVCGQTKDGIWSDHLVYDVSCDVVAGKHEIYSSNGSSILVYNKTYNELRKLSKVNGLTETEISALGFSDDCDALIIAYSNTNMDLVKGNTIINIPDIYRKSISGGKSINRIRVRGKYAYLACSFGIVVLNIVKAEIYETWKPGDGSGTAKVYDVAFDDKSVYAATDRGVYRADVDAPGLSYYGNWQIINSLPDKFGRYTAAICCDNKLYVNRSPVHSACDSVFVVGDDSRLFSSYKGRINVSFDRTEKGFMITSAKTVSLYSEKGELLQTIFSYDKESIGNLSKAIMDDGSIWFSDNIKGLVRGRQNVFSTFSLPGPGIVDAFGIHSDNGRIIVTGGGIDAAWNRQGIPFRVAVNRNDTWEKKVEKSRYDALRVAFDPSDKNRFFVSSWGSGLFEYADDGKDITLINNYTDRNSKLENIIPGGNFVRIGGVAFDADNNLWLTQPEVSSSIKVLKKDGSWTVFPYSISNSTIGDILITSSGHKWIVLPRGGGLFVLDDNGTIDNFSDDRSKSFAITDTDGKVFSHIYSIAEDMDGNIWAGTDNGPMIYYNADKILDEDIRAYRIKVPRNDGTNLADYMLGTETITSMSVDGANRKWLGTLNSGVYLLSPDGTTEIIHYNTDNSPLFSNRITGVSVDDKTGEVWFATSKGILSVRGSATAGSKNLKKVYAFPNPVRKSFTGNLTVMGLERNTDVRITDISGNIVYKTVSEGGMAQWDLTTYNGQRAATGVYLIFCASPDGARSTVIKVMVIN